MVQTLPFLKKEIKQRGSWQVKNLRDNEWIIHQDGRVLSLWAYQWSPHWYNIVLAEVSSDTQNNTKFLCVSNELFNTVCYDSFDTHVKSAIAGMAQSIAKGALNPEYPLEFVYALGGTMNHRKILGPTIVSRRKLN